MGADRVRTGGPQFTVVFTQGKLLLAAAGMKPSPQHRVSFEPQSPFADPPTFVLRQEAADGPATLNVVAPYQVVTLFPIGSPPDEVIVRYADAEERVPVLVPADLDALSRREPVPLVRMAASRLTDGEAGIPSPFAEMLEGDGEQVRTPILWPIRLGALFDGCLELAPADPRRATGYSDAFDFREAFLDALRSLPPDALGAGDRLTTIRVTETGALLGGLGSFQRMFVSILAY
jgi:hypothetical protein